MPDSAIRPSRANTLIIMPAYNEEECVGETVVEVLAHLPGFSVLVVDDGSADGTAAVAKKSGAAVLCLPCNLGVGGAVQAGFTYAAEKGYRYVVRLDSDGQHPPAALPDLLDAIVGQDVDMVIGSRFLGETDYRSTRLRSCGILCLAGLLSAICRKRVTDPTSGLYVVNRELIHLFSRSYPADYPEPEALALLRRQGYDFSEVAVSFRPRRGGVSSIDGWGTLYYMVKVFLALVVDRARPVDDRCAKANLAGTV